MAVDVDFCALRLHLDADVGADGAVVVRVSVAVGRIPPEAGVEPGTVEVRTYQGRSRSPPRSGDRPGAGRSGRAGPAVTLATRAAHNRAAKQAATTRPVETILLMTHASRTPAPISDAMTVPPASRCEFLADSAGVSAAVAGPCVPRRGSAVLPAGSDDRDRIAARREEPLEVGERQHDGRRVDVRVKPDPGRPSAACRRAARARFPTGR